MYEQSSSQKVQVQFLHILHKYKKKVNSISVLDDTYKSNWLKNMIYSFLEKETPDHYFGCQFNPHHWDTQFMVNVKLTPCEK